MTPGKFLTLEGIDGAGKSSHLEFIADWVRGRGLELVVTREPGGTELGEALRELLLNREMASDTELLLMFAARQEHLAQKIRPALAAGAWVLSDRFTDASYAYQCGGRGIEVARVAALEAWVQRGFGPDLTLLFDLAPETAARRRAAARAADRFEREEVDFFARVRAAYLARAAAEPARVRVLDSDRDMAMIQAELAGILESLR